MIKRTVRGFKKLKKKYYTPKVKKGLRKFVDGIGRLDKGTNSLVGDDDPYQTSMMFQDQYSRPSRRTSRIVRRRRIFKLLGLILYSIFYYSR